MVDHALLLPSVRGAQSVHTSIRIYVHIYLHIYTCTYTTCTCTYQILNFWYAHVHTEGWQRVHEQVLVLTHLSRLKTVRPSRYLSFPRLFSSFFILFLKVRCQVHSLFSVLCSLSSMFAANKFWRLVMWNACTFPSPYFGRFLTRIRVCCPSVSLTRRWRSRIRSSILSLPVFETRSYRCVLWMCGMDVWYGCVSYCVSAWDINWWRTSYALSHTSICHTHPYVTHIHMSHTSICHTHPYVTHILRTITHMCVIVRKITHLCVLARILCMCASDIKWSFKSKVIRTRYS